MGSAVVPFSSSARRDANRRLRRAGAHHRAGRLIDAERDLRTVIRLLRAGGGGRPMARALHQLGRLIAEQGRYRDAVLVFGRAIRHAEASSGRESLAVAMALNEFGVCCKHLARFAEAGPAYQRALHIVWRRLGHDHPDVATILHNLGGLEHAAGNGMRGEPFAREAVRIRTRLFGRGHPDVANDLTALAALLDQQGQYAEAESLYRRAIAIHERVFGAAHPSVTASLNNLAAVFHATRRPRQAEALYRRALAIDSATLPSEHPRIAFCRNNLAALLLSRGRVQEAESLCRPALATLRRQLGAAHPQTARCMENYAAILERRGRGREAARLAARAARAVAGVDAVRPNGTAATATINPMRASYRMHVGPSRLHRFGVFADQTIPAGRRVIEYTGEHIGRTEGKRRWDPAQSYLFELDSYWTIDGAVGGSGAEYINHSCAPNLVTRKRGRGIFYFSARRIAPGEELTVDYKYSAALPPMPCHCGAKTCRGTMNRAATG